MFAIFMALSFGNLFFTSSPIFPHMAEQDLEFHWRERMSIVSFLAMACKKEINRQYPPSKRHLWRAWNVQKFWRFYGNASQEFVQAFRQTVCHDLCVLLQWVIANVAAMRVILHIILANAVDV